VALDSDTCEIRKSIPSQDGSTIFASRFFVEIQQTAASPVEEFAFGAAAGTGIIEASCPLRPFPEDADALAYIASYQDLIEAIGVNADRGRAHYSAYGRMERRQLTFRPLSYVASHQDLFFLGLNRARACEHYIRHGFTEGRRTTFDPYVYLAGNPDLIDRIPHDEESVVRQYIETGYGEGRQCKPFAWRNYINANPDLEDVVPRGQQAAAKHFVLIGFKEGRGLSTKQRPVR
jgi:hypothetical protein